MSRSLSVFVADFLEHRLPDGGTELPDARSCYAAQPGKVRIQRQLWVRVKRQHVKV